MLKRRSNELQLEYWDSNLQSLELEIEYVTLEDEEEVNKLLKNHKEFSVKSYALKQLLQFKAGNSIMGLFRKKYNLYEYVNNSHAKYLSTYTSRKIESAVIDHIASVAPNLNENTLEIVYKDDELAKYRFILDGVPKQYIMKLS